MNRYTDHDCFAALIRAAAALNSLRPTEVLGVELPHAKPGGRGLAVRDLHALAKRFGVPVRHWNGSPDDPNDGPRLVLDHRPACYGGGVRPMLCYPGQTGKQTPRWWVGSGAIGPDARPRREFCELLGFLEGAAEHHSEGLGR